MINSVSSFTPMQSVGNYKRVEKSEKIQESDAAAPNKVAEIKQAYENNQYKLNLSKTSQKMAQDLLGQF
ncbi:flagellar biosynthesis anti-sigma factor FlgM [Helicobacter cetorum]|uniref:flagellar biosynthesis anti-sigma factor FlgM n=1 Tax=Helicobacter cetorum TaxID=138563 RepID=UPI000CF1B8CC|nr:flagellar biosynthesis anti-sigma factor FlgM [Helicobacter cetorum]